MGRPVARLVLLPKCTDPTRGWPHTMPMTMPRKGLNKNFLKVSEIRKDLPRLPRYNNCISSTQSSVNFMYHESSFECVPVCPYPRTILGLTLLHNWLYIGMDNSQIHLTETFYVCDNMRRFQHFKTLFCLLLSNMQIWYHRKKYTAETIVFVF